MDFLKNFEPIVIPMNGIRLPEIKINEDIKKRLKLDLKCDNYEVLKELCKEGFRKLKLKKDTEEFKKYIERVKYELSIVQELGFTDYFLLVWKVINFCIEKEIPYGRGRGSGSGSILLFLMGITGIDPIKNGLYFERFISKTRSKKTIIDGITYLDGSLICDIDQDCSYYRRNEIVEFLKSEYPNKTSKILTFNTLSPKLAIKEVGKVLGLISEEEMTEVTSFIPKIHGVVSELTDTYDTIPQFKEWCDKNSKVYETTLKLSGLIKNKSAHASGYQICYDTLDLCCPIELASDKEIVSSYDMEWITLINVKLDLLGLRCSDIIDDVCKQVGIKIEDIDLNDSIIYQNLYDLKYPHGIFQVETESGFKVCQKVKPKNFEEVSAIVSLNRPGAMMFIDAYANYTNHGTIPYFDIDSDKLISIMKETGGIILYQETLMRIAKEVFELTLEDAELIRKAVGKKLHDKMKEFESIIFKQGEKLKIPKSAKFYWDILNASASYSFNKSHASAYAAITCVCMYLKAKYPTQFYLALLKMTKHEPDPISEISKIHKEMLSFGIKLLPPSLKLSKMDFTIEDNNIRFGLSSIKGISDQTIEKLNNFKREHANLFEMMQCAKEAGLNIAQLSSLVQSGCMDNYKIIRSFLVYQCQLWNVLSDKEKQIAMTLGEKFDFKLVNVVKEMTVIKNEKGKPLIKESRVNTIRKKCEKYKEIYNKNKLHEGLANLWYELKNLGYSYFTTLKEVFDPYESGLETLSEIKQLPVDVKVKFVGIIQKNAKLGTSKNGNKYAKYESISDEGSQLKIMIFSAGKNNALDECKLINGRMPKEEDIVIVEGTYKGDVIFANKIAIQQNKIVFSFSDLKDEKTLD